jgi:hypothetical protein
LYNLIQVTRDYFAQAQRRRPETISSEMIFIDVYRQLISLPELADRESVVKYFTTPCTAVDIVAHVQTLLADVWHDRWIKSPKKKFSEQTPAKFVKGGHTSICRILQMFRPKPKQEPA